MVNILVTLMAKTIMHTYGIFPSICFTLSVRMLNMTHQGQRSTRHGKRTFRPFCLRVDALVYFTYLFDSDTMTRIHVRNTQIWSYGWWLRCAGVISYLNEVGELLPQFTAEGKVKKFALSSDKSTVATLTDRMMLSLHTVLHSGVLLEQLKLSTLSVDYAKTSKFYYHTFVVQSNCTYYLSQ